MALPQEERGGGGGICPKFPILDPTLFYLAQITVHTCRFQLVNSIETVHQIYFLPITAEIIVILVERITIKKIYIIICKYNALCTLYI